MITPNDIETKVFSYSVRGYNKREVDEFLDQIMIDYQALLDQNQKMKERIASLQSQVGVSDQSTATSSTLQEAKRLMNDISASAEQRAEVIIQNAEADAANIVNNAKNSTTQAGEDVEKLRRKIEKFKERYKAMLTEEIERIDDESEDILADLKKDFYPDYVLGEDDTTNLTRATGIGIQAGEPDLGDFAPEADQSNGVASDDASGADHDIALQDSVAGSVAESEEPASDDIEITSYNGSEGADQDGSDSEAATSKDPLIEQAEKANVDLGDLPGFRTSVRDDKMDDTVVLKMSDRNTLDLDATEGAANKDTSTKAAVSDPAGTAADAVDEVKTDAANVAAGAADKAGDAARGATDTAANAEDSIIPEVHADEPEEDYNYDDFEGSEDPVTSEEQDVDEAKGYEDSSDDCDESEASDDFDESEGSDDLDESEESYDLDESEASGDSDESEESEEPKVSQVQTLEERMQEFKETAANLAREILSGMR